MPTLTTERLVLRPFQLSDAADVQRLAGEREIAATTLNIPHPYEDGMAEQWISSHAELFAEERGVAFAITLGETGELLGAISLFGMIPGHRAELGYWMGTPSWGKGYTTEAAQAVLGYGFTTLGLNRIYATHFAANPASGRIMQKLGMSHEGVQRQQVKKWDAYDDLVLYGILKRDWEKNRE